jgi:hypothetical protein
LSLKKYFVTRVLQKSLEAESHPEQTAPPTTEGADAVVRDQFEGLDRTLFIECCNYAISDVSRSLYY